MEKKINSGGSMKKLVLLNVVCNGSTGKIMCDLAKSASNNGYDVTCIYGRGNPKEDVNCLKFNSKLGIYFHVLLARLGFNGRGSYFATKKLVKYLKKTNPDIIHMHNIHGYWINLKVLFKYLKNEYNGKVIWTLHDCWSFTGHCSYSTFSKCDKWQNGCNKCPILKGYPKEYFDTTKTEYKLKKKIFTGLKNTILVTPSTWLKELVKESFLKNYKIEVVNNGIDLDIFKPTINKEIYRKYNIPKNKKIILGVANIWEERKGLKDFIELSKIIDDDYKIVLVGLDKINEKEQNIICIKRTTDQKELANIYSIANVLLIPTYEDNYPTVILESIACDTPILTYDTGGCIEAMHKYGYIVQKKNYNDIIDKIKKIEKNKSEFHVDKTTIDKETMYSKYMQLYSDKK